MWDFDSTKSGLHVFGDWRGYYASVLRWHARLRAFSESAHVYETPTAAHFDDTFAFFVTCFHVADWLENDGAVPKRVAKSYVARTLPLMLCRDLCNGSKHAVLTQKPSVLGFKIGREYRGGFFITFAWEDPDPSYVNAAAKPGDEHRRTDLYRVQDLAHQCITAWEAFFTMHSLDPSAATV